jgi:hypothetical protein
MTCSSYGRNKKSTQNFSGKSLGTPSLGGWRIWKHITMYSSGSVTNNLTSVSTTDMFCCTFHGLDPLACSDSELTSEAITSFRHFGRTPTRDRSIAKPLSTQENTTQKTRAYIHALSRIRTHYPDVRAAQDHTLFRPHGSWNRHRDLLTAWKC